MVANSSCVFISNMKKIVLLNFKNITYREMRHKHLRNIYFLLNIVHFEHREENLLIFQKIESFFFFILKELIN